MIDNDADLLVRSRRESALQENQDAYFAQPREPDKADPPFVPSQAGYAAIAKLKKLWPDW